MGHRGYGNVATTQAVELDRDEVQLPRVDEEDEERHALHGGAPARAVERKMMHHVGGE